MVPANTGLSLFILSVLILLNSLLAMSEMAVVSAKKYRLKRWADEGRRGAARALELAKNPGRFFSTVQGGITLVAILIGAFGGDALAGRLADQLSSIPLIAPYAKSVGLFIVVAIMTLVSLVLGELVPKQIGLAYAEKIASLTSNPMTVLSKIAAPIIWLLDATSSVVLRLFRLKPRESDPLTDEELKILLEQGTKAGAFEAVERDMFSSILRLGDRCVGDLMTPRGSLVWLDIEASKEDILKTLGESRKNRYPVARGGLDEVLGVVQTRDLLAGLLARRPLDLRTELKRPLFLPEGTPILQVLDMLRSHELNMAFVVDEYGSFQGIVTLSDILAAIAGTLTLGGHDPKIVLREDGSWLLDGMLPFDEACELLDLGPVTDEERKYFHTLAGLVILRLGSIPKSGDTFSWRGYGFEVVDMDGLRIDKVLVRRQA